MKLYIIPAYEETVRDQGYKKIISAAKRKGYQIEILNLQIQKSNFENLIKSSEESISKDKLPNPAIFGFSIGALIAYKLANKIKFSKAFFCSISPLLEMDIPKSDALYVKYFGKSTVKNLKQAKYGVSEADKSYFFVGDSEGRKLPKRTKNLANASNGEMIVVKDNDHELNEAYVKEIISRL